MPQYVTNIRIQRLMIGAAVLLLVALVAAVSWPLRSALRAQIVQREVATMAAVVQAQRTTGTQDIRRLGLGVATVDVHYALLESPWMENVVAFQLFSANGEIELVIPDAAFVEYLPEAQRVSEPQAVFHPDNQSATGLGLATEAGGGPWLEVIVPVAGGDDSPENLWARYWLDGRPLALELAEIDRRLLLQVGMVSIGGGLVLGVGLGWAFSRLRRRGEELARANRELLMHTKTSAIGAISAHLMHGLKNPLAGLAGFIAAGDSDSPSDAEEHDGEAWRTAAETTRRIGRMINEVLEVLQDESSEIKYSVPAEEFLARTFENEKTAALQAGLSLEFHGDMPPAEVSNRVAAIAGLVLRNLLDNAMAATPRGGSVRIEADRVEATRILRISVADSGPGLPDAVKKAAFKPVVSSKSDGAGLGLALSSELARHAGGALVLTETGPGGTTFCLEVPYVVSANPS